MGFGRVRIRKAGESDCRLAVAAVLTTAGAVVLALSLVACGNNVGPALNTAAPTSVANNTPSVGGDVSNQAPSGNGPNSALYTPARISAASNTPSMGGDVSFPAPSASARGPVASHSNGLNGPPLPSPSASGSTTPSCSTTSPAGPTTTSPATTLPVVSPSC